METLYRLTTRFQVLVIVNDVVRNGQSLLAGCLCRQYATGLFATLTVASHQATELRFFAAVDHQYPVHRGRHR